LQIETNRKNLLTNKWIGRINWTTAESLRLARAFLLYSELVWLVSLRKGEIQPTSRLVQGPWRSLAIESWLRKCAWLIWIDLELPSYKRTTISKTCPHEIVIFNVHRASTSMAPTSTAARTLRYHTYSLTLLGHSGNRQMAIVAITVGQWKNREKTVNIVFTKSLQITVKQVIAWLSTGWSIDWLMERLTASLTGITDCWLMDSEMAWRSEWLVNWPTDLWLTNYSLTSRQTDW